MKKFAAEYESRMDGELLQLWVERADLVPEAVTALQSEIARRGSAEDAANAKDVRVHEGDGSPTDKEREHRLAPAVEAWGPTIAWYWLREVQLNFRTRGGVPVQATVVSSLLTRPLKGRGGGGRRAELRYSYDWQGSRTGRTVRDFVFGDKTGKALAFNHKQGDTITIRVDPNDPDCSYFPSGFGWFQPLLYAILFSTLTLFLLTGAVIGILNLNWHR